MSNTSGPHNYDDEIRIYPNPDCHFAYTLNNYQPVRCTWISDQPLFFADAEISEEEDIHLSDDPVFLALEKDIAELQGKAAVYEKISRDFRESEDVILERFREDADFISEGIARNPQNIDALTERLHQSRLASQYLTTARLHDISLQESRQVGDARYDREAKVIFIHPDLDPALQCLLAARELRRMWQHKNGAGLHPLMFHPDHAVIVNRAQNADLMIGMIRIAWELQLAGYKDAWIRIENSQMSDLGQAFAREACTDFRALNSGQASAACFESWFLSERCRKSDRALIQQMLADYHGYAFSDNIEASRSITTDMMLALGKMPFGHNYLAPSINRIMNDPVFTDVRDRSNANFLWFIKFERSFTESEKDLDDTAVSKEKLSQPEMKTSGTIIAFPERAVSEKRRTARKGNSTSSTVTSLPTPL
jgi:hypothetical protein